MTIGLKVDQVYLNNQAGNIAVSLRQDCLRIDNLLRGTSGWTKANYLGIGYSDTDADSMIFAVAALKKARDLIMGVDTQPSPVNLMAYIGALTGID